MFALIGRCVAVVALSGLVFRQIAVLSAATDRHIVIPTPTHSQEVPTEAIIKDFHTKLAAIFGRPPKSTTEFHLAPEYEGVHLQILKEQMNLNRVQPIAFIGRTKDSWSRLYAYPIEPTPTMNKVFGHGRPHTLRWAVFAVPPEHPQSIQLLTYAETRGLGLSHVRWTLGQKLGSWGTNIVDALRRS